MTINLICVHCSATPPSMDIGAAEIDQWHKDRGFTMIGYNYVIRRDGSLERGRPEGAALAHARGFNEDAIAVCLVGGVSEHGGAQANFQNVQMKSLRKVLDFLSLKYPEAEIKGHRDLPGVKKDCPSFNLRHWISTGVLIEAKNVTKA